MEPLILLIEPELDERAATATMSRAQRVYEEGARDISRVMRQQITQGTEAAGRGFEELETKARKAYLGMQDAGDKVAAAERKADAAREKGASNAETLARRAERARLDEIDAIQRATAAYKDYEDATKKSGQGALSGLRDAVSGAGQSGGDMANEFVGGFASSSALLRLGASTGPIGLAVAGVGAIGYTAGKVLADNIAAGMATLQMRDLFQARLGADDASMARYGDAAGQAYVNMFGASVEDNLRAVQFGVQSGMIAPGASDTDIQKSIERLQTLSTVMEVDVQEAARAAGQLMRGGMATDGKEAADIIASGFQNGLNIAGDWLDTITEYSTQFRKLGLDGADAIGLITQGLQGGARDSDKVADSLKEFSIRAVDGSKSTAEGFAAIGFNADQMAQRFLAGGDSARQAFAATLDAIKSLDDPIQQAMTWQALFGTQWEDMGGAINSMDLSKARAEFDSATGSIDKLSQKLAENVGGWDGLGRQIDVTFGKLQTWLADSSIGKFLSQGLPNWLGDTFFGPDLNDARARQAAAEEAEAQRRAMGSGFANAGEAQRARRGLTPGADGLTPGPRTPILTETQRAAQEAAKGGTSLPDAPQLALQYSSTAGLPSNVANAVTRLDEARHSEAEKEARLNQLRQSNVADANDIQKAENDLAKASQSRLQAEQALTDARVQATEKANKQLGSLSNDMNEMGNKLDADFGLSKGLGGFLENVVKAVGNALTAPFLAALGIVEKANPNEGSGLIGIAAANGAFGQQYTPGYLTAIQGTSGNSLGSTAAPMLNVGAPTMLRDTGSVPSGPQSRTAAALIEQYFGSQLRGTIGGSRDNNTAKNTHDAGLSIDIPIGPDQMALGDQINAWLQQNAGALGLEYSIWRDQGKYPGGGGFTAGGHQNHIDAHFNGNVDQAAGALTNLTGAVQQTTTAMTSTSSLWDKVAQAESSGNWGNQDTGNNGHYGGLQFSPETWRAFGGVDLTGQSNPANASREQQIEIANRTAFTGYNGQSPQGLGAWEAITNGSVPGVSVNTPASAFGVSPGVYGGGVPNLSGVPMMPGGGLPGMGFPQAAPFGAPGPGLGGPGVGGGVAYPSTGGNSGNVMGGLALDGAMAATSALDMMMPGAGAAAKIGIQLLNRTVGYGAQVAGIAGSGVLETLSLGDNPKGSFGASWLGKGLGGLAGAAAALPNLAGKIPGGMNQQGGGQQGQAGNTYGDTNINVKNEKASEDQTGKVIAEHQAAMQAPAGRQP